MNTAPPEIELLAPAGGWTQLHAAIDAGADAVYFGIDRFNMRSKAGNFREEELPEVVTALHGAGVRAYLTLNALVYERELSELREVVGYAKASFVDAVIAADIAAIEEARKTELPVHISTQMSIANSAAMAFWWDRGIRRFVLARECDLDAVARIRASMRNRYEAENMRLRIEAFAHGAMCVAVSGRCFMSGYDTGRSASRGDCAQPCRHAYEVRPVRGENEGFVVEESHVMSPRDICTLPFLEQVLDAGVNCLKIEGRNRSPDYVHTVVTAYRRAIDTYLSFRGKPELEAQLDRVKAEEMDHLSRVYNRGFSQGFYMGRPTQDWTTPPEINPRIDGTISDGSCTWTTPPERR